MISLVETELTVYELFITFFLDLNPTVASTDTDAHPEFHLPKTGSVETDDDLGVKVKVSKTFLPPT